MANELVLTVKALSEPKDLKGVFELAPFKNNFVDNYLKTTGRNNGAMVYERERVLFMKALTENKKLEKCDRFTIYAAFIELAVSGLTLNDGISYIIPYGKTAQFQIGWKGRLEQINHIDTVDFANEPQVVYTSELNDFDFELGENPKIIRHKPSKERGKSKDDLIEWVYFVVHTKHGPKTWIMSRSEVLSIRDTYSQTYKSYIADCARMGKEIGSTLKKPMNGPTGSYELTIEPPFWITREAEAFKKTIIKLGWKYLPKTPRLKALDAKLAKNIDPETGTIDDTHDINYGIVDDQGNTTHVDADNGAPADQAAAGTAPQPQKERKPRAATSKPQPTPPAEVPKDPEPVEQQDETQDVTHEEVSEEQPAAEENPASALPDLGDPNASF